MTKEQLDSILERARTKGENPAIISADLERNFFQTMKALVLAISLSLCCCTGIATVARPVQGTVSPLEYDEAEKAFAGTTEDLTEWTVVSCQKLLSQRDMLIWVTAFSGALGGAGGLSTAFPEDDNRNARLGLGISTAILAALSTSTALIAHSKSNEFEQYCNQSKELAK